MCQQAAVGGAQQGPAAAPPGKGDRSENQFRSKKIGRGQGIATHCYHKRDTGGPGSLLRYLCTRSVRAVAVNTVTHEHDVEHEQTVGFLM